MRLTTPPRHLVDLRVFGAATLPDRELVRLVCGPRIVDAAIDDAATALQLAPVAREAALLSSPHGPRLLAALELGRRAARVPSPSQARITGPADVVAAVGPRLGGDARFWLVAVDVRLRLARAVVIDVAIDVALAEDAIDDVVITALQQTLQAGCRRLLLLRRAVGPAVAGDHDGAVFNALRARGGLVGVDALDVVVLGDDGWCSLVRRGFGPPRDPRYR
jgi:hypothetical protein